MATSTPDEGWIPAIRGLFTFRVWRPGRSSVVARLRAAWMLSVLTTVGVVGVASLVGRAVPILDRSSVQIGWAGFAWFTLATLAIIGRLPVDLASVPAERIAPFLWRRWLAAGLTAMAPLLMALWLARREPRVPTYAVYWAASVSLPLQAAIIPSVRRLRRLAERRTSLDEESVIAAISAPTA